MKGDATIFYTKPECVENAVLIWNGAEIRPGYKVSIEPARFEQKGETYKERTKREIDEIARIKFKVNQEK